MNTKVEKVAIVGLVVGMLVVAFVGGLAFPRDGPQQHHGWIVVDVKNGTPKEIHVSVLVLGLDQSVGSCSGANVMLESNRSVILGFEVWWESDNHFWVIAAYGNATHSFTNPDMVVEAVPNDIARAPFFITEPPPKSEEA